MNILLIIRDDRRNRGRKTDYHDNTRKDRYRFEEKYLDACETGSFPRAEKKGREGGGGREESFGTGVDH